EGLVGLLCEFVLKLESLVEGPHARELREERTGLFERLRRVAAIGIRDGLGADRLRGFRRHRGRNRWGVTRSGRRALGRSGGKLRLLKRLFRNFRQRIERLQRNFGRLQPGIRCCRQNFRRFRRRARRLQRNFRRSYRSIRLRLGFLGRFAAPLVRLLAGTPGLAAAGSRDRSVLVRAHHYWIILSFSIQTPTSAMFALDSRLPFVAGAAAMW